MERPKSVKCVNNASTGLTYCGRSPKAFEFVLTGVEHAVGLAPSGSYLQVCFDCAKGIVNDLWTATHEPTIFHCPICSNRAQRSWALSKEEQEAADALLWASKKKDP